MCKNNQEKKRTSLPRVIAIDGPAASGKSTVGMRLADYLGYLCFDTGVMYRAVSVAALKRKIPVNNEAVVSALAESVKIDIVPSKTPGRPFDILLDKEDITEKIRSNEVNKIVSDVSIYRGVRMAMTVQQRRIAERGRIVMLGRDIGTVVLPNADLKIYLDASVEVRAKRRFDEEIARGGSLSYEEVLASIKNRDQIDSTREIAPLTIADDAIKIDTDDMTIDQVVDKIKEFIQHV